MRVISRNKVVYTFSPKHAPIEYIKPSEIVLLETQDGLGEQIKSEKDSLNNLDWSKVNPVTGPLFIEGAECGDTLVVEILDIKVSKKGIIITAPRHGVLGEKSFNAFIKIVKLGDQYIYFDNDIRVKLNPMIGTVGVAPESNEVPSVSLGNHGGNMDVRELTSGTKLYLPVLVDGALFAAGDVHAIQADGELCVSSIEVGAEILLRFNVIKDKKPKWPILETVDEYAILTCGDTLDEAARIASEAAVEALMREYGWPFEKAYMFGSLSVNLRINQVVDPKKGVRAAIPKNYVSLNSLL